MICECCKIEFIPKYQYSKNTQPQRFCSRACSNRAVIRRAKRIKYCIYCGQVVSYHANKFCNNCKKQGRHNFPKGILPTDLQIKDLFIGKKGNANCYNRIRYYARQTYLKSNCAKKCYICGYDKHFEVCHKTPISSFSILSNISEVNSLANLVALCPNCHWEYDHGLVNLPATP